MLHGIEIDSIIINYIILCMGIAFQCLQITLDDLNTIILL